MPPSIITIETVKALISDVENPLKLGVSASGSRLADLSGMAGINLDCAALG